MNNEDKFYTFKVIFENNEIPEAAKSVLIHELLNNIFRSQMVAKKITSIDHEAIHYLIHQLEKLNC